MFRFLTAGESHGPGLVTIVDGVPKGTPFSSERLSIELRRRRHGHGRGDRMKIEEDELEVLGGIRHGLALGSPVAVVIRNTEWPRWSGVMAVEGDPEGAEITRPRPGHADLPGMIKYDTDDARDILERASARETAARAVAGYVAKEILELVEVQVGSHVTAIGKVRSPASPQSAVDLAAVDGDPVRCADPEASEQMVAAIDQARESKDTLGGVFEVLASGVPAGLGSHVQHDRRIDAQLAAAVMSIPAIKGVEIGDGFHLANLPGSAAHDEIVAAGEGLTRASNRAGGVEGGMTNGQTLRVSAAMKPLSTLMQPLRTVDVSSGEPAKAVRERSDVCAVPAASVVGEHMIATVLARALMEKFGGDTVTELTSSYRRYAERIADRLDF